MKAPGIYGFSSKRTAQTQVCVCMCVVCVMVYVNVCVVCMCVVYVCVVCECVRPVLCVYVCGVCVYVCECVWVFSGQRKASDIFLCYPPPYYFFDSGSLPEPEARLSRLD